MWKANSFIQDLNSGRCVHFQPRWPLDFWNFGGRWQHSWYFVGYCFQNLLRQVVVFLCNTYQAFSLCFISVHVVSIAFKSVARRMLISFSVDEMLLPRYVNWSTYFRGLPRRAVIALFCLKYMNSFLFTFTVCSRLYSRDLVLAGVCAGSARSST